MGCVQEPSPALSPLAPAGTALDTVEVESYDPYTDTWTPVSPALKYVSNFSAAGCRGRLYLVGSSACKYNALALQCYNPVTGGGCGRPRDRASVATGPLCRAVVPSQGRGPWDRSGPGRSVPEGSPAQSHRGPGMGDRAAQPQVPTLCGCCVHPGPAAWAGSPVGTRLGAGRDAGVRPSALRLLPWMVEAMVGPMFARCV